MIYFYCIDHILINSPRSVFKTETVFTGLSDIHKLVLSVFKLHFSKTKAREYTGILEILKWIILIGNLQCRLSAESVEEFTPFQTIFKRKTASEDNKLRGPLPTVENIIYDVIDDSMVLEAVKITERGCGPSWMDADGWRRILVSRDYCGTGNDIYGKQ